MSEEKPVAALRRALAAETDAHEIYRLTRRADSVSFAAGRFEREGVDGLTGCLNRHQQTPGRDGFPEFSLDTHDEGFP